MGRKAKFSQEKKLEIVRAYLEGKASCDRNSPPEKDGFWSGHGT